MIIDRHKLPPATLASLKRFATRAKRAASLTGEVSILITSSEEVRELNRQFRRKNKPTDVLSFPSDADGLSGDIAISAEVAQEQADSIGHNLLTELQVLVLHGMLHLAGHDHETDKGEMRELEAQLRHKLGLDHGLIERAHRKRSTVKRTVQAASKTRSVSSKSAKTKTRNR